MENNEVVDTVANVKVYMNNIIRWRQQSSECMQSLVTFDEL